MSLPIVPLIIAGVAILLSRSSGSSGSNSGSGNGSGGNGTSGGDTSGDGGAGGGTPLQTQFIVTPQMKHDDLLAQVQDIWGGGELSSAEAIELAVAASSAVFPDFPKTVEDYQAAIAPGSNNIYKNRYKNIVNYTMGLIAEVTGQTFYFGG